MNTPDHVNGSDLSFPNSPALSSSPLGGSSTQASFVPHPTAARSAFPGGIEVDLGQANTRYTESEIRARFVDRGANVELVREQGKIKVQRTEQAYEFKTQRAVPKTGCVGLHSVR
jgi:hypothetical protein